MKSVSTLWKQNISIYLWISTYSDNEPKQLITEMIHQGQLKPFVVLGQLCFAVQLKTGSAKLQLQDRKLT